MTLLDRLGLAFPIIQAPMAGVSCPAMAAAVSEAGALGSLGLGAMDANAARAAIADTQVRTARPFNVNLFCHQPAVADPVRERAWIERLRPAFAEAGAQPPSKLAEIYTSFVADPAMLAVLLDLRPAVVSLHFGVATPAAMRALREARILILGCGTSLKEAEACMAAGVDGVIAQGWEAGGHRGIFDPDGPDERLGTLELVRRLAPALPVPVIAAGGIMDGSDIADALAAGAVAAQLGTAFVACDESLADAAYRAALASAPNTVMTRAVSGRPARCLANRFTALGEAVEPGDVPDYPITYDAGKALNAAGKKAGETGWGAQWAGTGASRARPMPAARLVAELAAEVRLRA